MEAERIILSGMPNTRDLGGYFTKDGRKIKEKRLIRSGALGHGTKEDFVRLTEDYGLVKIIDFRTGVEKEQLPDPVLSGVEYIHNPIFLEEAMGISREKKLKETNIVDVMIRICTEIGGDNNKYMEILYPLMVTDAFPIGQFGKFFRHLAEQKKGSILYHCSEGKDRVGTATALFLSLMGVSEETVMEDYLLTNVLIQKKRESILSLSRQRGCSEELLQQIDSMNSVDGRYLQAVFEKLKECYGSVEGFFQTGMGFSKDWIEELKENYLES